MSFNRVKAIKRASRERFDEYGKAGPHCDTRKSKERRRPHTSDFMREYEDEVQEAKRLEKQLEDQEDAIDEQEIWGDWGADYDPDDDGPYGER